MQINFLSTKKAHKIRHSLKFLFILFLSFLTLGLGEQPTGSTQPVRVAVIDNQIHTALSALSSFTTEATNDPKKNPFSAVQNFINSQYTQIVINDMLKSTKEAKEYLTLSQNLKSYPYIQAFSLIEHAKLYFKLLWGTLRYMTDQSFRDACDSIKLASHGTHIAGLIIQYLSPEQINIIPISRPANNKIADATVKADHDYAQHINSLTKDRLSKFVLAEQNIYIEVKQAISNTLKEGVKVVNMSFGVESYHLSEIYNIFKKSYDIKTLTHAATFLAEIEVKLWQEIIHEHPDTVFVLAAGNQQTNLNNFSSQPHPEGRLPLTKANNLIVVGALDQDGNLAKFSNHGSNFVDVLALGVDLPSVAICGGTVRMSGTSMAAPLVTNKITQIIYEHPNLTAPKVIEKFLAEYTQIIDALKKQVEGGRCLPVTEFLSLHKKPPDISLLQEILRNSGQTKEIIKKNPHLSSQPAQ